MVDPSGYCAGGQASSPTLNVDSGRGCAMRIRAKHTAACLVDSGSVGALDNISKAVYSFNTKSNSTCRLGTKEVMPMSDNQRMGIATGASN